VGVDLFDGFYKVRGMQVAGCLACNDHESFVFHMIDTWVAA